MARPAGVREKKMNGVCRGGGGVVGRGEGRKRGDGRVGGGGGGG